MCRILSIKRLFVFALFVSLVVALFFGVLDVPETKAVTISQDRVFASESNDGQVFKLLALASGYGATRNASSGTVSDSLSLFDLGQNKDGTFYYVHRGFVFFDTSLIPDDANITSVTLSFYIIGNYSDTEFNVTVQNGQPTYPHTPLEGGDYYHVRYSGDGGSRNTSEISDYGYWNITLNTQGEGWIDLDGTTKLCLRSSRDISNIAPTGNEYLGIYTMEKGVAYAPKLYVTYEVEGYRYLLYGAFYETGLRFNGNTSVSVLRENEPQLNITLDGNYTLELEQQPLAIVWNISATEQNKTRTYYLTSDSFEEIYVFIPNDNEPFYLYTFELTDFVGITNGFVETIINVNGTNRVVERYTADVVNIIPFWMTWAHRYNLRLICDQGTYLWGSFLALTTQQQNLVITAGMFPTTYEYMNVSASALRMNSTWIQVNYTDNQEVTAWLNVTIKYQSSGSYITSYTTNNTGDTQQIDWHSAVNTTNYIVDLTASRNSTTYTWSFACPTPALEDNPWDLDVLGLWPIQSNQFVGMGIVMFVLAVFSYQNIGLGCVLTVVTAGILNLIGWLAIGWDLVALAFSIAFLIALREAKKRERII